MRRSGFKSERREKLKKKRKDYREDGRSVFRILNIRKNRQ